jgi:hypothetical protein
LNGHAAQILTDPGLPSANSTVAATLALAGRDAEAHEVVQRFASLPSNGLKTIAAWNAEKARITHQHPNPRYLELWDRLTDAVYVFFNAAVSARGRFARGDVEQRLVSARGVCGHQLHVELGVCAVRCARLLDRQLRVDHGARPRTAAQA